MKLSLVDFHWNSYKDIWVNMYLIINVPYLNRMCICYCVAQVVWEKLLWASPSLSLGLRLTMLSFLLSSRVYCSLLFLQSYFTLLSSFVLFFGFLWAFKQQPVSSAFIFCAAPKRRTQRTTQKHRHSTSDTKLTHFFVTKSQSWHIFSGGSSPHVLILKW